MLSIHDYTGHELPYAERYRLIAQAGFDAVLMWYGDDYGAEFRETNRPAQARSQGLFIENVHAPFDEVNHLWEDTPDSQRVFAGYLQCLEDCARYEIPTVVMHADRSPEPPPTSEIGLARWTKLVAQAEQFGVNIAIENMRFAPQIDKTELLLEHFNSPRLGFCFDSGHWQARRRNFDWLDRWPGRLMALHLHDNDHENDLHLLPFDGTVDWLPLMRQIANTGYAGPTTLEVARKTSDYEHMTVEEYLAQAHACAMKLDQLRNQI